MRCRSYDVPNTDENKTNNNKMSNTNNSKANTNMTTLAINSNHDVAKITPPNKSERTLTCTSLRVQN